MISREQQILVQDSFPEIYQHKAQIGAICYEHFFAQCPSAKQLFTSGFSVQNQMLVEEMSLFLRAMSQDTPLPKTLRLTRMHKSKGVTADQFPFMRDALLDAFATVLGAKFTPELAMAWGAAFDHIAAQMTAEA